MSESEGRFPPADDPPRRLALHWKILIGLVIGAALGLTANALAPRGESGAPNETLVWWSRNVAGPIGQVFIRLILMVVVPLVFAALVLGIAEVGDVRKLGRIGLKTLALTIVLSSASVLIAIGLINTFKPGAALSAESRARLSQRYGAESAKAVADAGKSKKVKDALLDIIPKNPLQEMVGALDGSSPGGGMMAVMFFALIFGVAMTLSPERTAPILSLCQGIFDVTMTIIGFAMRIAPLAVAALIFTLTAELGLDILMPLAGYVAAVVAGLTLQMVIVYGLVLALLARRSIWRFLQQASEAILTAFSTSSSNATLPTALRVAQTKLGIRRNVSNFVLTVGATANQNGTALFEGVTVLFLAQVFGVNLTPADQIYVVLMCILAGIGTAGVPSGSIPLIIVLLAQLKIPPEGIGVILGVDRFLDMCRTTVNVAGDLTIAACVDRGETEPEVAAAA
jgi:DAACS family dicarboxylate/amino acid:cation (Na+ or H+) symporter